MKLCYGAVRMAACAVLSLSSVCTALSQQPSPSPDSGSAAATALDVDPKAHDAALQLVEVLGLKEKLAAGIDADLDRGVAAMKAQMPTLPAQFTDEWRKRMKERMKPDDFVAIIAQVYEKHFTADELDQLSNVITSKKEGKEAVLPDALKEKFQKNAVAIQSEIIGGTTQLGARLGGEVGEEIGKEHPEWAPKLAQPVK